MALISTHVSAQPGGSTLAQVFELLPEVSVPSTASGRASCYGIVEGLAHCQTETITTLAASALQLLQSTKNTGYGEEKVIFFINSQGQQIADALQNTCQKIEWLLSLAKFSGQLRWIQSANEILSDEEKKSSCPFNFFTDLSRLFAMQWKGIRRQLLAETRSQRQKRFRSKTRLSVLSRNFF